MNHATTDVNAALKQVNDFMPRLGRTKTKIEAVDSYFCPYKSIYSRRLKDRGVALAIPILE